MSSSLSHEVPWGAQGNLWPSPEEEEEEEEGLFKADAVNEEDPERDCATQEEVNQPQ